MAKASTKAAAKVGGDIGPMHIALLGGWVASSYGLYRTTSYLFSLIDGEALFGPDAGVRLVGAVAVGAALALTFLLLFGRRVGSNATEHEPITDPTLRWHEEQGISKQVPAAGYSTKASTKKAIPKFTLAEVAQHNSKDDLWIVVDEKVYDVTAFVEAHPGGVGPMAALAGKDVSDVFANYHAIKVYKYMLPRYFVGVATDVVEWEHVKDFRAVRQELLRRGLFETDYRYYTMMGLWLAVLFFGAIFLSLGGYGEGRLSSRLLGGVIMGIFWQQLAGCGHDLGHSGVTHDFHLDHKIGSALTAFMGLSLCWWKSDHNTHHVVCNSVEDDPNIQHMPMLAINEKIFAQPFWDAYHKKWVAMDAAARFLVSYQHVFFYPLMAVGRLNLYVQGLIYLLTAPDKAHYRNLELCGLGIYGAWLYALASSMPTAYESLLWVLASHAAAGMLHVQIVLSHWSMDVYKGKAYNDESDDWYTMQMKTTMNVATFEPLDWVHIGLQFQVEHHLYPRLPRHSLRAARDLVRPVCEKHGIHYHEPGFFAGNLEMWHALRDAALEARKTVKGNGGFYQSALYEGLNISG